LNNFVAASHGILQTGPQNLTKFAAENYEPYKSFQMSLCHPTHKLPTSHDDCCSIMQIQIMLSSHSV